METAAPLGAPSEAVASMGTSKEAAASKGAPKEAAASLGAPKEAFTDFHGSQRGARNREKQLSKSQMFPFAVFPCSWGGLKGRKLSNLEAPIAPARRRSFRIGSK